MNAKHFPTASGTPGVFHGGRLLAVLLFLAAVPSGLMAEHLANYRYHDGVALNDLRATPGVVRSIDPNDGVITGKVSTKKYRHTTPAQKASVYKAYGVDKNVVDRARFCTGIVVCDTDEQIAKCKKDGRSNCMYEIDHVCSLELLCADGTKNLMPQPYYAHPGAHEKDAYENWLHAQVKAHKISPARAQTLILTDWYQGYLDAGLDRAGHPDGEESHGRPLPAGVDGAD